MKQLVLKAGSLLVLTLASFQCTSAHEYFIHNRVNACYSFQNKYNLPISKLPIKVRLNFQDGTYHSEIVGCYGGGGFAGLNFNRVSVDKPVVSVSAAHCTTQSCEEADQNVKPPSEGGLWFHGFPAAPIAPGHRYIYVGPDEVVAQEYRYQL